jgi:hypothetical protein
VSILVIAIIGCSTLLLANARKISQEVLLPVPSEVMWIPSEADIAYQDSMFNIVENTSMDMDTIKVAIENILYKLDRLEYADGTYDSIRYAVGSQFDINRSNRN